MNDFQLSPQPAGAKSRLRRDEDRSSVLAFHSVLSPQSSVLFFISLPLRLRLPVLAVALLIVCSLGIAPFAVADTVVTLTADRQFDYAQERFAAGDFTGAAVEYRRFVHFFPEDPRMETALLRTGTALDRSGDTAAAIRAYGELTDRYVRSDPARSAAALEAYRQISRCHVKMGDPGRAVLNLRNLIALTDDPAVVDDTWYRIGWLHIETGAWQKAQAALARISDAGKRRFQVAALAEQIQRAATVDRKDPALAGLLSVVPGLGQLYCNRPHDALIAFAVNGALIAAAWEAFDGGNTALGGLIGTVGLGFYTGNIYGAVNSARKYNRSRTADFIERMQTQFKVGLLPAGKNPGVGLWVSGAF